MDRVYLRRVMPWARVMGTIVLAGASVACGPAPAPEPVCTRVARFADLDGDGFGAAARMVCAEGTISGLAVRDGDCNDRDPLAYPGAVETCVAGDQDCDGRADEGVATAFTIDADGDGYGSASAGSAVFEACGPPFGYSRWADDCDDADATTRPYASETCNDRDDDCNGAADDGPDFTCRLGETVPCTTSCGSTGTGPCTGCGAPEPALCVGPAESCNGADEDCDDLIDEGARVALRVDHEAMGGATRVEAVPTADGWVVIALMPGGSIVAQAVGRTGTLGPLTTVTAGPSRWFAATASATHVYVAWLTGGATVGSSLYATHATIESLAFGSSARIGYESDLDPPLDLALVGERLVYAAYPYGRSGFLVATTTTTFTEYATRGAGGAAAIDATLLPASTGTYVAWSEGSSIEVAWLSVDAARGWIGSPAVRFNTSSGTTNRTPRLSLVVPPFGVARFLLTWSTGTGYGAAQVLTLTPTRTAIVALTEPARIPGAVANGTCALGATALDGTLLLGWESGTTDDSTIQVDAFSETGARGAPESIGDAAANGCASFAPAASGGALLVTVARTPHPVSFVWGC